MTTDPPAGQANQILPRLGRRLSSQRTAVLIPLLLILLGSTVITGWLLHKPLWVQLAPGLTSMVMGTAACFLLSGLSSLAYLRPGRRGQALARLAAATVLLVAGLNALELLTGLPVSLSLPRLHAWLHDNNPHPGRMSPPTTLAFLLASSSLLLLRSPCSLHRQRLGQTLSGLALLLGGLAVMGYLLRLEPLFDAYFFSLTALHTGVGLCLLALFLLQLWQSSRSSIPSANHIARFGALACIVAALISGLLATAWFRHQDEQALRRSLSAFRLERAKAVHGQLETRSERASIVITRPSLIEQLQRLEQRTNKVDALTLVRKDINSLMPYGFSSISLHDARNQLLFGAGSVSDEEADGIEIRHVGTGQASLIWQQGFVLRNRMAVFDKTRLMGFITTEQPLPLLTRTFTDAGQGNTIARSWLCGRRTSGAIYCFSAERGKLSAVYGEEASALFATSSSPAFNRGTWQIDTGSVGDTGLQLSVAVDRPHFYGPLRQALASGLLAILMLALLGGYLLRRRVLPLARQLAASESRQSQLIHALGEGLMLVDEQQRILMCNPAFLRIVQLEEKDLLNRRSPQIGWSLMREDGSPCHPDDYPSSRALRREIGEANRLLRMRRADGKERWLRVSTSPYHEKGQRYVVVLMQDISSERQALEKAQIAEQRYQLMIGAVRDYAIYMLDPEGRVASWNEGAQRLKGYKSEEIIGQDFSRFYTQDDRAMGKPATVLAIAARDGHFEDSGWRVRKDGSWFWASVTLSAMHNIDHRLIGYTKVTRDLTEQHRATEALRQSAAKYRLLVDGVADGVISIDDKGQVRSYSKSAERMFGFPSEQVIGRNVSMLMPERFRAGHDQHVTRFALQQDPRLIGLRREVVGMRADGSEFPMMLALNVSDSDPPEYVGLVSDISEPKRTQRALDEAHRLRELMLTMSPYPIISCAPNGTIRYFNPAAERMLLYAADELIGQKTTSVFHDLEEVRLLVAQLCQELGRKDMTPFEAIVYRAQQDGFSARDWTFLRKDGSRLTGHLTLAALRDAQGELNGFVAVLQDVSENKRREEYTQHIAHHDFLTGLPNRLLLNDRLEAAIERAQRHHQSLCLMMIDLDHFKRINDSLGHHIGDELLKIVGKRLQTCVRGMDTVARLGGDEFIVLIEELHHEEDAIAIAQKILDCLALPVHIGNHLLPISSSIGLASFPNDAQDANDLIRRADSAMYHAKESGRGRYKVFTQELEQRTRQRAILEDALRQALVRDELILHYQPQIDLDSGQVCGMEALLRWNRPGYGLVPPDQFITLAEEVGLMIPIGDWVLKTACRETRQMQEICGRRIKVAVNLSAPQFLHERLEQTVQNALRDSGLPPQDLELEITESALMDDAPKAQARLSALRALGVSIAIDDFGVGYSSLSYLSQLAIDVLKIDRSFITRLPTSGNDAAVVDAILSLAHSLNLNLVAEGVERPEQLAFLRQSRLRNRNLSMRIQGFILSPAVTSALFVSQIGAWNEKGLNAPAIELV